MGDVLSRRCKVCRATFEPKQAFQTWCSVEHGVVIATRKLAQVKQVAQVKDKRETRARLDKMKSKAQWAREAQTSFNAFIRLRDADQPCISCGRHHQGQYHAGHYLSVGARPELRFEESNVHKQCAPCNTHLSGNAVLFRRALMAKLGLELVEWLEGYHEPRRDTIDDLKALKAEYTAKTKQLKEAQA